jgi:hypothetical protein
MSALPPEVGEDEEIAVTWEPDDLSIRINVVMGEVAITVDSSYDAVPKVPFLVGALPQILEAAWAAIENEQSEED